MNVRRIYQIGGIYLLASALMAANMYPSAGAGADAAEVKEIATGPAVEAQEETEGKKEETEAKEKTASKKKADWTVKLKKCSHPKKITRGVGFTVKGELDASKKMKKVTACILDEDQDVVYQKKVNINKKSFSLDQMDEALKFSELNAGDYSYVVKATNTSKSTKTVIDDEFEVKKVKWSVPVNGGNWGDGWHCQCSTHRGKHYGWDIRGGGRIIHAVSDGTVVYAKYHNASSLGSFGNLVIIYHGNGIYSYYAHCASLNVKAGKKVQQGDVLGKTGATGMAYGAHLHFELRKGPDFSGGYNDAKLVDKYTYVQFNPAKKIKR